jgi:hypothetical protein
MMYVRYLLNKTTAGCKPDTSDWIRITASNASSLGNITPSSSSICSIDTTRITFDLSSHNGELSWYLTANNDADTIATQQGGTQFAPSLSLPGYIPNPWLTTDKTATRSLKVVAKNGSCANTSKTVNVTIYRQPTKGLIAGSDTVVMCSRDTIELDLTASLGSESEFPIEWCGYRYVTNLEHCRQPASTKTKLTYPGEGVMEFVLSDFHFLYGKMTNGPCVQYTDSIWINDISNSLLSKLPYPAVLNIKGDTVFSGQSVCSNVMDMNAEPTIVFRNGGLPVGFTVYNYKHSFNGQWSDGLPNPLQEGTYIFKADTIGYGKGKKCYSTTENRAVTIKIIGSAPKLDITQAVSSRPTPSLSHGLDLSDTTLIFCGHDTMTVGRAGLPSSVTVKWYVSGNADISDAREYTGSFKLDRTWSPKHELDTMYYAIAKTYYATGNNCDTATSDTLKIKVAAVPSYETFPLWQSVCLLDTIVIKFRSQRSPLDLDSLLFYLDTSLDTKFQFSDMLYIPRSDWTISGDTVIYKYLLSKDTDIPTYFGAPNAITVNLAQVVGNGCYFPKLMGDNIIYSNALQPKRYDTVTDTRWINILFPTVIKDPAFLKANSDTSLCPAG